MRVFGTVARGVRTPILQPGDELERIVVSSVLNAAKTADTPLQDRDVIAVTESVLARTQGNYVTLENIAEDVRAKIPQNADGQRTAGIVWPILSRNRFSMILKGIARGLDHVYIQLAFPSDEVGNALVTWDQLDEKGVHPDETLTEERFRALFGARVPHQFTGVDYIELYHEFAPNATIFLSNDPTAVLAYTKNVIACDIHTRHRTVRRLQAAGATTVLTLSDLCNAPVNGSGYNREYGLLGSNMATPDTVKLFPRGSQAFAEAVSKQLSAASGKQIEAMVYGDGAFKDPVGGIWELADPVVSPGFTEGLAGLPNELKLKYLADTELKGKEGAEADEAARRAIRAKSLNLHGKMASEGTTPRRMTDLLGSLCDLTSGSGDKGTPVVWISGYFDNFAD